MISEFGGLSLKPKAGQDWFGYATTGSAQDLLALYDGLVGALLDSKVLEGFCYTQLTDTEQETNGLLTAAREPKLNIAAIRAINTRPSAAVPSEVLDKIHHQEVATRLAGRLKVEGA